MFRWEKIKVNINSELQLKLQELLGQENVIKTTVNLWYNTQYIKVKMFYKLNKIMYTEGVKNLKI